MSSTLAAALVLDFRRSTTVAAWSARRGVRASPHDDVGLRLPLALSPIKDTKTVTILIQFDEQLVMI